MGTTEKQIAYSISNTIPPNSNIVTSEKKYLNLFNDIAKKKKSTIKSSNISEIKNEYLDKFPYIEHPENIALA